MCMYCIMLVVGEWTMALCGMTYISFSFSPLLPPFFCCGIKIYLRTHHPDEHKSCMTRLLSRLTHFVLTYVSIDWPFCRCNTLFPVSLFSDSGLELLHWTSWEHYTEDYYHSSCYAGGKELFTLPRPHTKAVKSICVCLRVYIIMC